MTSTTPVGRPQKAAHRETILFYPCPSVSIREPIPLSRSVSWKLLLSSSTYFVFLVAIFLLYWPLARVRAVALAVILFANYFFYAKWDIYYLALIPIASTCDYFLGLGLQTSKNPATRRLLVSSSIVMNLGLLVGFKYMPFLLENIAPMTGHAAAKWNWTLPLSLSFYVFQALTYTIDIYRG